MGIGRLDYSGNEHGLIGLRLLARFSWGMGEMLGRGGWDCFFLPVVVLGLVMCVGVASLFGRWDIRFGGGGLCACV